MIAEYVCSECGLRLNTDSDRKFKCLSCGSDMDLDFEKKWVGTVQDGSYQVFEKGGCK